MAAAPPGWHADAWMCLVADEPSAELRAMLAGLLERARLTQAAHSQRPTGGERALRLAALRAELSRRRLAGFIVPRSDEHQGEYVAAHADRLAWLTGFTGSAGSAVVLAEAAALLIDGRYTVQAAAEVDGTLFVIRHATREPLADWLARSLQPADRIGYDPWLHTPGQVAALQRDCTRAGARLVPLASNPLDRVWRTRPPPPIAPVVPHPIAFAGDSSAEKRKHVAATLRKEHQDATFLAQPDAIAWLLNIRGGDIPFTPLPLAFALLDADETVTLFVDACKLTAETRAHLGNGVTILPTESMAATLSASAAARRTVRIDPDGVPDWVARRLRRAGAVVVEAPDPCLLPKAIKSGAELAGIRAAHRRDGVALSRFLAWLPAAAASGELTESAAAERLATFRADGTHYRGPSFPTISAAAGNGAIVHYRVSPATDRPLEPGTLYLVDSGGQYLDGTTDVTRTIAIGAPSPEMCERFTLVLKGHIALAMARFPLGTTGSQLDALARAAMWRAGLDYDHGTGHGVGMFLGVHEGPQRISKLPNRIALQPGMVVSNEPGYYKTGGYGIRIENLVAVRTVDAPLGAEIELLGFETLTLAPIDRTLVRREILDDAETAWLDAYHRRVRERLSPELSASDAAWLQQATRPI